ncbi:HAMP domain-containing histidine kinase [Candidatus Roizmanbacteria bacterium]|nr:HAMP domain-containing histidine kinase [Candidatus Roizmanbacteria bacterium]
MFKSARIKLTAWYLFIIMLISISFSAVIFRTLTKEFERFERLQRFRIERRFFDEHRPPPEIGKRFPLPLDPELIKETKNRLGMVLVLINAGILILSGGLGYLLAGRTLQPIQDMVDEQNRFISDASHELRTPLTSLKTSLEVTARDKNITLENAKTVIVENIGEVNRLQSLSDELLQLTQYEKSNASMEFKEISISEIVRSATKKIAPLARQKNISIIHDIEDCAFIGNKYALIDLLVILLDNAIKYSPRKRQVILESKKLDNQISITVKDQGIGIDEKDLPHIFDRFYRADLARSKTQVNGYGLGLSIAKKIVAIHHGSIAVESKHKKGTVVKTALPIKQKVFS